MPPSPDRKERVLPLTSMATLLVVNPRSADGSTGALWPRIARTLEQAGVQGEVRFTEGPDHATRLVREGLAAGPRRVVVVGGDGTVNEAINGFFDLDGQPVQPEAELAVLCRGTGCDFVKSLRIPRLEPLAIERIAQGTTRPIDVGRVRYTDARGQDAVRYFCNIAEAGLGGAVVDRVNRSSKRLGGFLTFLGSTLLTFATYRNTPMTLTIDDLPAEQLLASNVVIGNGRYFGGGMCILPEAALDDGRFDVLVMGDLDRLELFANIAKVYQGTHLSHPKLRHLRASRVRIDSPEPLLLDVDGEQPGVTPAEFTLLPGALKVRC